MKEQKRCFSMSDRNIDWRMDGEKELCTCWTCSKLVFPRCSVTEERIMFAMTGPVGNRCPLPKKETPPEPENDE